MTNKAKDKSKEKRKVDSNIDPLADLGLDAAPTKAKDKPATKSVPDATKPKETAPVTPPAASQADHSEVKIGDLEFGFSDFIPATKRKVEGSKYNFDKLAAPGVWAEGPSKGKPKIANFFVALVPGEDEGKLKRSVQSATTQANKHNEAEGKYFASRSRIVDGKFAGMVVYRTDTKPTK